MAAAILAKGLQLCLRKLWHFGTINRVPQLPYHITNIYLPLSLGYLSAVAIAFRAIESTDSSSSQITLTSK